MHIRKVVEMKLRMYEIEINKKNIDTYAVNLKNYVNVSSIPFQHVHLLLLAGRSSLYEPHSCIAWLLWRPLRTNALDTP